MLPSQTQRLQDPRGGKTTRLSGLHRKPPMLPCALGLAGALVVFLQASAEEP